MSRTHKDEPYDVRKVRNVGRKFDNEMKKFRWSQRPKHKRGWNVDEYRAWEAKYEEVFGEIDNLFYKSKRYRMGMLSNPPSDFRRDLNRSYRAKTKQQIREGKEPDLFRKNANWLWW